jgi:hypothetical protein
MHVERRLAPRYHQNADSDAEWRYVRCYVARRGAGFVEERGPTRVLRGVATRDGAGVSRKCRPVGRVGGGEKVAGERREEGGEERLVGHGEGRRIRLSVD